MSGCLVFDTGERHATRGIAVGICICEARISNEEDSTAQHDLAAADKESPGQLPMLCDERVLHGCVGGHLCGAQRLAWSIRAAAG